MKLLNSTGWSTDALQAVVDQAVTETAQANTTRHLPREFEEVHFKPSSHHEPVRVVADIYRSKTMTVHIWQPIKFKNKLDELTRITASAHGYQLGAEHAAKLLVEIKAALGFDFSVGVHYRAGISDAVKQQMSNAPVITERLPEEGRREDAQIKLELTVKAREEARKRFEEADQGYAARIDELQRSIDFNTKKLEKMRQERAVSK